MTILPILEVISGLIALGFTAMAFTNLAWAEGASSPELKRESATRTRRLFIWAGVFWALTVLCLYLSLVWRPEISG
jgi:fatty acid desaturase